MLILQCLARRAISVLKVHKVTRVLRGRRATWVFRVVLGHRARKVMWGLKVLIQLFPARKATQARRVRKVTQDRRVRRVTQVRKATRVLKVTQGRKATKDHKDRRVTQVHKVI